jgi:dynein heavy chain
VEPKRKKAEEMKK